MERSKITAEKKQYYDMHCHLLPGVDDGSKNMEETLEAMKMAYEQGLRSIICTPHYDVGHDSRFRLEIEQALDKVKARLRESGFGKEMELYLGAELMYSESLVEKLDGGDAPTMAGSHYVLIEFLPSVRYEEIYGAVGKLGLGGYFPILAHVERYECLFAKEDRFDALQEMGAYFQVNASSLLGGVFDRRGAALKKLCKASMVHFIGTDSHGTHYRPPQYAKGAEWIDRNCDSRLAEQMLFQYPEAVLHDCII